MIRILAAADLHIGASHLCTLEEQERSLDAVQDLCVTEKADLLLIAGDLFHHNRPSPEALKIAGHFFERLRVPVLMAKGNHDPDASEIVRYFRGQVIVPSEPGVMQRDGVDIAVMPYLVDRFVRARLSGNASKETTARELTSAASDILSGFLAQRRPGVPLVLVAHGTVAGTETSSGWSMGFIGGTEWRISVEDAAQFDLAVVGHIHRHQSPAPNVVVPGSLLPLDFSETDPHGVIVADVGPSAEYGRGLSTIYVTTAPTWRFVEIPGPRVATWDIQPAAAVRELVQSHEAGHGSEPPPEKLRVRLTCDEATAREFPPARISAALYAAGAVLVQVELNVTRADRARDETMTSELLPGDALTRYLAGRDDLSVEQLGCIADLAVEPLSAVVQGQAGGGDLRLTALECADLLGVHEDRLELDGAGVVVLSGANGSGKSTVGVEILRYSLFGESRAGAKMADRLIRHGADVASAAVELQGSDGDCYRIVRQTKKSARGPMTSLDVLKMGVGGVKWWPLSTGKIVDGEREIARILGGLSADTLTAANIVVQRSADRFTRARPEERKSLLADAAGLSIYDDLANVARERHATAEHDLALLHARAIPLRDRAAAIPDVIAEIDDAMKDVARFAVAVQTAQRAREEAEEELRKTQERASEFERVMSEAAELQRRIDSIDAEVSEWTRKQQAATAILAERGRLEAARAELHKVRTGIVALETMQVVEAEEQRRYNAAVIEVGQMETRHARMKSERERGAAVVSEQIESAEQQETRLADAECCAPEPSYVFLDAARAAVKTIPDLARSLATYSEPGTDESALINAIGSYPIPDEPDTRPTFAALAAARVRARELEDSVKVAEKIARAEEVLAQHDEATRRLRAQREDLSHQKGERNGALIRFGGKPNVERASDMKALADSELKGAQRDEQQAVTRAAELRGRLATLTDARVELAAVEGQITLAAADVAAWKELTGAWKACRVLVLESSVIPAVERAASEILRMFPHGLQIAFSTQREKRDGAQAETLDIEVLGGKGELYEMCSGGEQTTIDVATHIAIALVVSRRASTRLSFMTLDEPEGLDAPSRAAFAQIVRWLNAEHGLTCVVMSHMDDLIDALGGTRIEMVQSADGSTVVAA